nr:transposase [Halomonas sp. 1513]
MTKRKSAVVMDTFKSKTTIAEVTHQCGLTVSEVKGWIYEVQGSMVNGAKAIPKDICEQYKSELWATKVALGEAHL